MLISVSHLSKYNNLKCIVDDVSFTIHKQDKIALIGLNGTGKSTLLKILARQETYQGDILYKKDIQISYLSQTPDFQAHYTALQQVYEDVGYQTPEHEVKAILNKFAINAHQIIQELSGGQKKRVALAIALLKPCDLLLLDEPTNHLDNEMIEYLEKYLMKWNKALIMVTHDRYFLERITHQIFELDRCQIYTYQANYQQYLEQKNQREETIQAAQHKRKQFLKKELEWVRAGVQARSTKSKDRLKRFETLSQQKDVQSIQNVEMFNMASRLGNKTIELKDVSMCYQDVLFAPFSYHFQRNEHVGIIGHNGCGKSTLLNIIAQIITPSSGQVILGETLKIGYFQQGHDNMNPQQRVIDYIEQTAHVIRCDEGELTAKQMCERFLFDTTLQYTPIERLSGGEKRRLYLLKVLMEAPNVLLLDEPTNDLDITTLQIFEDYLDHFQGLIITVSHDRYFLDRICDTLFVFQNHTIQVQNGGYSAYLQLQKAQKNTSTKERPSQSLKRERLPKIRLSYQEKQELKALEQELPLNEKQLAQIDEQMNDSHDFSHIQALSHQRNELEALIEQQTTRLLELLEKEELSQKKSSL